MVTERQVLLNGDTGLSEPALSNLEGGFRPPQIVSLCEIVKPFAAGRYLLAVNAVGDLIGALTRAGKRLDGEQLKSHLEKISGSFEALKKDCETLELPAAFATAEKIVQMCKSDSLKAEPLRKLLDEFRGRMADELKARECFLLTLQEAHHYKEPLHGWKIIVERFPAATRDTEEAWKCFACSRYTAAVFHSLQIVEVGLIDLGAFIGVKDPISGWTAVAQRLKKIIDTKYPDLSEFEKANRPFLEQVQGTVEALKNAWRNKVSHVHGKLTLMTGEEFHPDVAEEILLATRAFMRRLTEGLPSKKVEES